MVQWLRSDIAVLSGLALIKLLLHLYTNGQYGFQSDELYYIASGEHLDWGYTEFPPFIAVVSRLSQILWGDSLSAMRFFPAVAGALLVLLTGIICRQLGGGRFAQFLAALLVLISPYYLSMHTLLTMNAFEPLWWTLTASVSISILQGHSHRRWLWVGFWIGVGLLTKFSMLLFAMALYVSLFLTNRYVFRYQWIWLGMLMAMVMTLPTLVWQAQHGWPFHEQQVAASIYSKKPFPASFVDLFVQPILLMQPITCPIWLAGIFFYFQTKDGKSYRFLGWVVTIVFGLLVLLEGKSYYFAPIFPILFAGGSIVVETCLRYRQAIKIYLSGLLVLCLLATLPMSVPLLPIGTLLKISQFYAALYSLPDKSNESFSSQQAPWHFRTMLGREEMVANVSDAYHNLPQDDRTNCAILAWNYGNAGAIDRFAQKFDIPKVISGAHGYYFWGPRNYTGEVVISLGGDYGYLKKLFRQVEQVGTVTHKHTLGIKSNIPIYLCRGIRSPLPGSWSDFKAYFNVPVSGQHL